MCQFAVTKVAETNTNIYLTCFVYAYVYKYVYYR